MSRGTTVLGILDSLRSRYTRLKIEKFNSDSPTDQGAVDLFKGRWASALPDTNEQIEAGPIDLFVTDNRPRLALRAFGRSETEFAARTILELGPLEAGHTFQLEGLGAKVDAIEGNTEAFLKCLIVKELYGLQARFHFGDFSKYMMQNGHHYDLVFASGVLYHMSSPLDLISQICKTADRSFVWTHYYDSKICGGFSPQERTVLGHSAVHFRRNYFDRHAGQFWGGLSNHACWLERETILSAFRAFGHKHVEVLEEDAAHRNGPSFSFVSSATPL